MRRVRALVDEGVLPPVDGFILNKDYFRVYPQGSSTYSLFWDTEYERYIEEEAEKDAGRSSRATAQQQPFAFPQPGSQRLSSSPPLGYS